jgi:surface carbohydrate biosynthesis protein
MTLRLEWRLPRRVDVLIVFTDTSHQLREYFPQKRVSVLDLDDPTRNVFALLASLIFRRVSVLGYLAGYVALSRPRLVVSMQDNFEPLWHLKALRPDVAIALVQNGLRTSEIGHGSLLHQSAPEVDHYFCFNNSAAEVMRTRLRASYTCSGSFRSNHTKRILKVEHTLAYISTFRSDLSPSFVVDGGVDQRHMTYGEIWASRVEVLRRIRDYGQSHELGLRILGKDLDHKSEFDFYVAALGASSFDFVPRRDQHFQHAETDRARIVVSTGSTLGLESLSRGNRTAIFDQMPALLNQPSQRFGWPSVLPTEGPFWSESATADRIATVIRFLIECSDAEWQSTLSEYQAQIPVFDPGNSLFCEKLKHFGAQSPLRPSSDT